MYGYTGKPNNRMQRKPAKPLEQLREYARIVGRFLLPKNKPPKKGTYQRRDMRPEG